MIKFSDRLNSYKTHFNGCLNRLLPKRPCRLWNLLWSPGVTRRWHKHRIEDAFGRLFKNHCDFIITILEKDFVCLNDKITRITILLGNIFVKYFNRMVPFKQNTDVGLFTFLIENMIDIRNVRTASGIHLLFNTTFLFLVH